MKIHPFDVYIYKNEFSALQKVFNEVFLVCQIGSFTGLIASVGIEEVKKGHLKKHENILIDKAAMQAELTYQRKSAIKPVLLTYPIVDEIEKKITQISNNSSPDYTWDFEPKIQIWATREEELAQLFRENVTHTYIADGHHRTACIEKLYSEKGNPFDHLMVGFFSSANIKVHEYNRVLTVNEGLTLNKLLSFLEEFVRISPLDSPQKPNTKGSIVMSFLGQFFLLQFNFAGLDVVFFQENIFEQGVRKGLFTSIEYPEGSMNWNLEKNKSGFCLFPLGIEDLISSGDEGKILPPKSTWITPRMVNGIIKMNYNA